MEVIYLRKTRRHGLSCISGPLIVWCYNREYIPLSMVVYESKYIVLYHPGLPDLLRLRNAEQNPGHGSLK